MRNSYRFLIVIITSVLVFMGVASVYLEQNKPKSGSATDNSSADRPVFHICVPDTMKEPIIGIISDTFKTLIDKYGPNQEKFRVQIDSAESITDNLLDEMAKREIIITQMIINTTPKISLVQAGLNYKRWGATPVAVIASNFTGTTNVSSTVLKNILLGKIDDWSKVSDRLTGKIAIYTTDVEYIGEGMDIIPVAQVIKAQTEEIINHIAGSKDSIGIIPLAGLTDEDLKKVTVLSVDNVLPTEEQAVTTGRYPYIVQLYLFWSRRVETHRFFEELIKRITDKSLLKKYRIIPDYPIVISIDSCIEKPFTGIISDVLKTLNDKYNIPAQKFIVRKEDNSAFTQGNSRIGIFVPEEILRNILDKWNGHYQKIGTIPLGVIISKEISAITDINSSILIDVITNKITDWSKVSPGLKGQITFYSPPKILLQYCLNLKQEIKPNQMSTQEIIKHVAEDKNSIAIVPLVGLSQSDLDKVTILSIDKISPADKQSVKAGKYPYAVPIYVIFDSNMEADESFKKLVEEFIKITNDKTIMGKYGIYR